LLLIILHRLRISPLWYILLIYKAIWFSFSQPCVKSIRIIQLTYKGYYIWKLGALYIDYSLANITVGTETRTKRMAESNFAWTLSRVEKSLQNWYKKQTEYAYYVSDRAVCRPRVPFFRLKLESWSGLKVDTKSWQA
jgi:hypothetical protein